MTTTDRAWAGARTVRVWDPLVRAFHWSLVATVALAWLSADEVQPVHEVAGYVVAGLIAFRLVWGLIGGRYARFSQFVKGPGSALAYLRTMLRGTERRYIGHNPAGAAMIVALLLSLSGTALTGWLSADPALVAMLPDMPRIVTPAWADDGREEEEETLEDLHEVLANLSLFLVALHVGGVLLSSLRHRENLVHAMVTGRKRAPGGDDIA